MQSNTRERLRATGALPAGGKILGVQVDAPHIAQSVDVSVYGFPSMRITMSFLSAMYTHWSVFSYVWQGWYDRFK
jgi:hypothetical protein